VDELQRMGCESAATMMDEKSDVGAVKEEEQLHWMKMSWDGLRACWRPTPAMFETTTWAHKRGGQDLIGSAGDLKHFFYPIAAALHSLSH
jgi:hypothetical protein